MSAANPCAMQKARVGAAIQIMRRVLRKICAQQADQLGDVSSLADPGVVTELITKVNAALSAEFTDFNDPGVDCVHSHRSHAARWQWSVQ